MILYIENSKDTTKKLRIHEFIKVSGYKINIQKPVAFLYTNSKLSKREIRRTISFTIAPKATKYQGINLSKMVKDLHSESYKTLRKEMKDHKQKEECIVLMD